MNKPQKDGSPSTLNTLLGILFPVLCLVGYITSIGVYAIGPAIDRFDKTRYLLNFAGQRSTSYYLGIFLADFLIFEISAILIILLAFILNIEIITIHGRWMYMFMSLTLFGFPFISLSYAIGYIFKNPETGYKYSMIFGTVTYAFPLLSISFGAS